MKRGALHYLEPIDTPSRGVAVLDAMAEMIERAGLQVGDRLPPEVAIAAALGRRPLHHPRGAEPLGRAWA